MGNTSSNPKITKHDKAVLELKLQRDKLRKSKQRLAVIINREDQIAKQCVKAKKLDKAKLALRKKKRQQSLLDNLERQSNTLEELIDTIEFKLIEKDVLYGLEQGNKILKEINSEMSIEKVEKILDDTEEAVSYQNELSERLGTLLTNGEEEEIEDELEQLEREMGISNQQESVEEPGRDSSVKQKLDSLPAAPNELNVPENKTEQTEEERGEGEKVESEETSSTHNQKVAQLA